MNIKMYHINLLLKCENLIKKVSTSFKDASPRLYVAPEESINYLSSKKVGNTPMICRRILGIWMRTTW